LKRGRTKKGISAFFSSFPHLSPRRSQREGGFGGERKRESLERKREGGRI